MQTGFNEAIQFDSSHPLKDGKIKRPVFMNAQSRKGAHFTIEFESRALPFPQLNSEDLQIQKVNANLLQIKNRQNALKIYYSICDL